MQFPQTVAAATLVQIEAVDYCLNQALLQTTRGIGIGNDIRGLFREMRGCCV